MVCSLLISGLLLRATDWLENFASKFVRSLLTKTIEASFNKVEDEIKCKLVYV